MKYIQQKKPDKSNLNNLRHVWKYHIGCQIAIRLYKYYNNDMYSIIIINTLRFLWLSVSESVTDVGVAVTNLRVVCNIIACHAVCKIIACVPAVTEIFSRCKSCCWSGHSELQATRRMPLWTLAIALTTGKNIRLFGVLDQNTVRWPPSHFRPF